MYLTSTPWWLRAYYPTLLWQMPTSQRAIYLTFDDGPHPIATPYVLNLLKAFNAKATFFCIGKNVARHPAIYEQIIHDGHAVGNHTNNHLNGWNVSTYQYLQNIAFAEKLIHSPLFRPPYGRITKAQIKELQAVPNSNHVHAYKIIMWSTLSGDFDSSITPEKCWQNVLASTNQGSIIVFHDSDKALDRLQYTLPKTLEHYLKAGYEFKKIGE